jgi:hypothetical protein
MLGGHSFPEACHLVTGHEIFVTDRESSADTIRFEKEHLFCIAANAGSVTASGPEGRFTVPVRLS